MAALRDVVLSGRRTVLRELSKCSYVYAYWRRKAVPATPVFFPLKIDRIVADVFCRILQKKKWRQYLFELISFTG